MRLHHMPWLLLGLCLLAVSILLNGCETETERQARLEHEKWVTEHCKVVKTTRVSGRMAPTVDMKGRVHFTYIPGYTTELIRCDDGTEWER